MHCQAYGLQAHAVPELIFNRDSDVMYEFEDSDMVRPNLVIYYKILKYADQS